MCEVADQKEGNLGIIIEGINLIWRMAEIVAAPTTRKILIRKPRPTLNHYRTSFGKP
jgi:hypothetical protein